MSKPSLQEIAAMPLPASLIAVRRHYDPDWRLFEDEGEERPIVVTIDYEVSRVESIVIEVLAATPEQARTLATAELRKRDSDVTVHVHATRLRNPRAPEPMPNFLDTGLLGRLH